MATKTLPKNPVQEGFTIMEEELTILQDAQESVQALYELMAYQQYSPELQRLAQLVEPIRDKLGIVSTIDARSDKECEDYRKSRKALQEKEEGAA